MPKELKMPKLRPEMTKGMLAAWLKQEGESFEKGEALFEVETDKVVNQVEATQKGVIKKLIAEEGDELAPGEVIAVIEDR